MRIEIDDRSGFCFGVVNTINKAEEALGRGETVVCLGDIVHNRIELQRLENLGLGLVHHNNIPSIKGGTVLIRAHGEPPTTYKTIGEMGANIIDATCPVVSKLQKKVVKAYQQMQKVCGQVVILGKKGHAEVIGLTGQVNGDVLVVEEMEDLSAIDYSRPIYLLSQTTQSLALFEMVSQTITDRAADGTDVTIDDTICRQVANREPHLREFAQQFDIIIFVSGKKSSNGKVLFDVCRKANQKSYFVEDENEIRHEWFDGVESVGICGATSTPKWLMDRIKSNISKL